MPYAQHQTKKNNASLCNIKCKIIVVFPFRKGCWAVGLLGRRCQASTSCSWNSWDLCSLCWATVANRVNASESQARCSGKAMCPCNARKEWDRSKLVVWRYVSYCYSGFISVLFGMMKGQRSLLFGSVESTNQKHPKRSHRTLTLQSQLFLSTLGLTTIAQHFFLLGIRDGILSPCSSRCSSIFHHDSTWFWLMTSLRL